MYIYKRLTGSFYWFLSFIKQTKSFEELGKYPCKLSRNKSVNDFVVCIFSGCSIRRYRPHGWAERFHHWPGELQWTQGVLWRTTKPRNADHYHIGWLLLVSFVIASKSDFFLFEEINHIESLLKLQIDLFKQKIPIWYLTFFQLNLHFFNTIT